MLSLAKPKKKSTMPSKLLAKLLNPIKAGYSKQIPKKKQKKKKGKCVKLTKK